MFLCKVLHPAPCAPRVSILPSFRNAEIPKLDLNQGYSLATCCTKGETEELILGERCGGLTSLPSRSLDLELSDVYCSSLDTDTLGSLLPDLDSFVPSLGSCYSKAQHLGVSLFARLGPLAGQRWIPPFEEVGVLSR